MRINGPALSVIRERSGLSPRDLAEAVGIDRTTLVNIEAGRRNPSPAVAKAIARELKVKLVAILADPDTAADDEEVAS